MFIMGRQVYKALFPYDHPNHPSRLKKFRDDPDNWDDRWFLCDRPGDCLNDKRHGVSSAMSLGQTREFLRGFHKQAKHTCNDGF